MQRVALLGGTFDPVHLGHVHVVRSVLDHVRLDELWVLPNAIPPHKAQPLFSTELRFHLCKAVFSSFKQVYVKSIELELPLPSYSVQTLRHLHKIMPTTAFLWILGIDAWKNLAKWYQWQEVLQLANWLVLNRPGYECGVLEASELNLAWAQRRPLNELEWNIYGSVAALNIEQHPASSTHIRQAYTTNQIDTVQCWLPDIVFQTLKHNKLS